MLLIDMMLKASRNLSTKTSREFGSANPKQPKYGKDNSNNRPSESQSKPQENKGNRKMKKDNGKWCDFHKIPGHNTNEYHSKQLLVAEIKDMEPNHDSESDSENTGRRQIIDAEPTVIVATAKNQPKEPANP
jgi:hypothetical protein